VIVTAVVGGLSACSSEGPPVAEAEPTGAHDVQASPTPTYLDQVGPDGLIHGKTLTQLSGEVAYECLVDRGWVDLQFRDDGSISGETPEEQQDAYNSDWDACSAEAEAAYPFPEVTEKSLRERYDLEVENRECLMDAGYTISEPPSVDVWIDQVNGRSAGVWLPYGEVMASSTFDSTKLSALYEACPDPAMRVILP